MTYCVGLLLDEGLVMLGDTRTNAGFDNISCFSKLQKFHVPGERLIATLTAGNLAISQAVLNMIQDGVPDPETGQVETIYSVPTMFRAAALVGEAVRRVHRTHGEAMKQQDVGFDVSIMLGGQIEGRTLISMDSTLRSNLSVGMPLDLLVYRNDSLDGVVEQRIEEGDAYFATLRERWSRALSDAHRQIPAPDWLSP